MDAFTVSDFSTLLRDVLPFVVIMLLVMKDRTSLRKRESKDVWTLRKTKGKG